MNLNQITSLDLKRIAKLLEQKESLLAEVALIDGELLKFESGGPAAPSKLKLGRKPGLQTTSKRAPRGSLKAAIVELVKQAGKSGIRVKEIAEKLGLNQVRVFTWFYTTGKNIKEIKKAGRGQFAWTGNSTPSATLAAPALPPSAKSKAQKPTARKAKGGNHGVVKDTIINLVKTSGKSGIAVKDIAQVLGVDSQRVFSWFNTTGKKVKEIKKVGRGQYAWKA